MRLCFCFRFVFSPRSSVYGIITKGGWAGAKVASTREEPGAPGAHPSPVEDTVGSAHTHGGWDGRDRSGRSARGGRSASFRAQSRFPARGNSFLVAHPPCRTKGEPALRPELRAARPVFSETGSLQVALPRLIAFRWLLLPHSCQSSSRPRLRTTLSSMKIQCCCLPGTRWWLPPPTGAFMDWQVAPAAHNPAAHVTVPFLSARRADETMQPQRRLIRCMA